MLKIKYYSCMNCDSVQMLEVGDDIILKGDYYHDKIRNKIEGFLEGLRYAGIEFEVEKLEFTNCANCEDD